MHYRRLVRAIGLSSFLLSITLVLGTALFAAPETAIYWRTADEGLPDDIQALAGVPSVLYAGTWGEGVYRSSNHGTSWQPANTGITLPLHIQSGLEINPVTPTQLFVGDYYGGGLYLSNNGGISWTLSLSNTAIGAVAVHPVTPTIVLGLPLKGNTTLAQTTCDRRLAATFSVGGYAGTAVLTATTDVLSPQSVTLVDGVGETQVTFTETARDVVLTAALPEGPAASSAPFDVVWYARIYLPLTLSAGESERSHRSEVPRRHLR